MKEYLFRFEGKQYITSAGSQMDAEIKFWDEVGFDPETCREIKVEEIFTEEVIYF